MDGLIKEAAKVIKSILYINIASVTPSGRPWNSPVYCAYDKQLNFYWFSWKLNQHSKNIRNNANAFVTIYDSTVPAGTGFGVYLEGQAYEVSNVKDMLVGLKEVYKREKKKPREVVQFLKKFPRRVYKFVPEKIWVNGDRETDGNFIDVRTELDIKKLKATIFEW